MNENFIKRCIYDTPLVMESFTEDFKDIIRKLLPVDTGIEIECSTGNLDLEDAKKEFENIPGLVDFKHRGEVNLRIAPGYKGMIALYKATQVLKKYYTLNPLSGIHYHVDFRDAFTDEDNHKGMSVFDALINGREEEILEHFDDWDYKGTYNARGVRINSKSVWVSFRTHYKTMEVRIGEMTFDYSLIIKRILNCHEIAKKIKNKVSVYDLGYWMTKLKELEEPKETPKEDIESIIKSRIIKL